MTDAELAKFLDLPVDLVVKLPVDKRIVYERMAQVEFELGLWLTGLGPKPAGVMVDLDKKKRRA